ncbi:carbohydrate binding family 9 domain-containing protein, partial [bacterium]|nr:carbohydrate binding family 9 domain-containing protein [bacterium]
MKRGMLLKIFWLGLTLTASAQNTFPPPSERPTIRAGRANGSLTIDGTLDDPDWLLAKPANNFTQIEPNQGNAPTFDTEVRVLFDDNNLYVAALCFDTAGYAGIRVPDLRRDFDYFENDVFGVSFDPFLDERNSQTFQTNPYGAQRDMQVIDGQFYNTDWNDRWKTRTGITDSCWTVEMAIPWSTLRYPADKNAEWGINFVRNIRRNKEITAWSAWPRVYSPYRMDYAGVLRGLSPPPPSRNFRIQPYISGRGNRVQNLTTTDSNTDPDIGGDLKWALTPNSALDLTFNTDFAEADADRQVINTTRFSVFFPEKRQFFLENASLFDIGSTLSVKPFFSRRIGLDNSGQPIAIDAGGRFTFRNPDQSGGALLIRQRGNSDNAASTFGVARYSRNIGDVNRGGVLLTHRYDEALPDQTSLHNSVVSVDGLFRITQTFNAIPMVSRSWTDGGGNGMAANLWIYNRANWGYIGHFQSIISENYNAATGFVRRQNLIVTSPAITLDWRPKWKPRFVRKFDPGFTGYWYHRASDQEFQEGTLTLRPVSLVFRNGGWLAFYITPNWQRLQPQDVQFFRPFGIELAAGDYVYWRYRLRVGSDQSKAISTSIFGSTGDYYDGKRQAQGVRLKYAPSPHAALTVDYELNQVSDLGINNEK